MSDTVDIGLGILDHQLLDCEGRRCGKVDDLAVEGGPGEAARVVAILSGPDVWAQRSRRIGRFAAWIGRGGRVRVPWEEVESIDAGVHLRKTARELGLGSGDDRAGRYVAWIPGSDR